MFDLNRETTRECRPRLLWQAWVDEFVMDLAWCPRGQRLALITVEGRVLVVTEAHARGQVQELGRHAGGGTSVSWRSDGRELATSGQDGLVKLWDPHSGTLSRELDAGHEWVAKVAYRPRRAELASAAGKVLRVWSRSPNCRLAYESDDHRSTIADIGWNPDGSGIAVAAYYGLTLHLPARRARCRKYEWKGSSLILAWNPKSRYIATGEQDSTVHFWHVKSGQDFQMWGFPCKVLELAWHYSGNYLATGGGDSVVLWDCSGEGPAGRKPEMYFGHSDRIVQLAFQNAGDVLASGDGEGAIFLWQPTRSTLPVGEIELSAPVSRLAWSPNDQHLAIGHRNGTVTLLEIKA